MTLSASNLTKSYTGHTVLDIPEAHFGTHGIEGLIGPNGAGKSTLLGCLTRRIEATTGAVSFGDAGATHDLMAHRAHEVARLGLVKTNQKIQAFDSLTIRDNLRLAANPPAHEGWRQVLRPPTPDPEIEERIDTLLARFAFADPDGFAKSGGEKKLLDILRCVVLRPRMLLMDEPTAGLPEEVTQDVMRLVRDLVDSGEMTVVIIEHDLDLIWANCAFVHFLSEGSILFDGAPQEVKANRVVAEKYMGI